MELSFPAHPSQQCYRINLLSQPPDEDRDDDDDEDLDDDDDEDLDDDDDDEDHDNHEIVGTQVGIVFA